MTKLELEKIAVEVRKGIITGVHSAKSGHPGGSLSAAEIFTYLYFVEMNVDPKNPKGSEQRQICSFQRTCSTGSVCDTCTERIFSGRRAGRTAPHRLHASGTS